MKLYLTQHGEALSKIEDANRPLSDKGKSDVVRLAVTLKNAKIRFDRVLHSGKLRAQQTAESVTKTMESDVVVESSGILNPNDDPKAFAWQDDCWDKDMLVVGHLPFLAKLVSHLLINDEEKTLVAFKPGCMICLNCDDNKTWTIEWMMTPECVC